MAQRIPHLAREGIDTGYPQNLTGSIRSLRSSATAHPHCYYVYSEDLDTVSPAELCCHTLLIDDGSRHRSYCLLLLSSANVDEADLREQAAKYDLEDEIDALPRYLETEGEVNDKRLPEWDEFQELAADFKIES